MQQGGLRLGHGVSGYANGLVIDDRHKQEWNPSPIASASSRPS